MTLVIAVSRYLPDSTITMLSFQGLTARAAYLKDASYIYALGAVFFFIPFHHVLTFEHRLHLAGDSSVDGREVRRSDPISLAVYLRPGLLLIVLFVGVGWSQLSIAHIFEHLERSRLLGLYMSLVQIGRLLGVIFGLECVAWYHLALTRIEAATGTKYHLNLS